MKFFVGHLRSSVMTMFHPASWARKQFECAEFAHESRNKRAVVISQNMLAGSTASLPAMAENRGDLASAYRFFGNKEVTVKRMLSGHVSATCAEASKHQAVLVVQDSMAASYGGDDHSRNLGPVNDSEVQGLWVHTALALTETGEVLGVLAQDIWVRSRKRKPKRETTEQRRKRARESLRWAETASAVALQLQQNLGKTPYVIEVGDREADIYDFYESLACLGQGFVIRILHPRKVKGDAGDARNVFETVAIAPVITRYRLPVVCRSKGKSITREVTLEVRAQTVTVMPPKRNGKESKPITLNLVCVREPESEGQTDRLEWNLATTEPIATPADVRRVIDIYKHRWKIEEFHMGLKTGCAIEDRELDAHGLKNFIAMSSIVAVKFLQLRDVARASETSQTKPATDVLTPTQLVILRQKNRKLPPAASAFDVLIAVARMGGFVGTNKGSKPGWRTLWRGFSKLRALEEGYLLASERADIEPFDSGPPLTLPCDDRLHTD
jgi:hypothetical protein